MKNIEIARPAQKQSNLEAQNTRTLMQTFLGCRKNCRECREEEEEWEKEELGEPKIIQKEVNHA